MTSQREQPDRHHQHGAEGAEKGHRDRKIQIAAQQNGPHVGRGTARRTAEDEQTQSKVRNVGQKPAAYQVGQQRHEQVLGEEADDGSNGTSQSALDRFHVQSTAHVDVVQTDQNNDRNGENVGPESVLLLGDQHVDHVGRFDSIHKSVGVKIELIQSKSQLSKTNVFSLQA